MIQRTRFSLQTSPTRQVVVDQTPVLAPVGGDDGVVVVVDQGVRASGLPSVRYGAHLTLITSRGPRSPMAPLPDRRWSACWTVIS
jgi:hypothetical protein